MKALSLLKYLYIILVVTLSLQACNSQPSDGANTTSSAENSENGVWLYNLNEAQAQSVKRQKSILVYFTNSDTCSLCTQQETNVFATPVFKTWAEKNVVLLEVDFSTQNEHFENNREQYSGMAQSLKVSTYPTTWILSITHEPDNNRFKVKPIGTIAYQNTPEKYIGMLQNLVRK
jgi:thioredoxin-related protein